MRKTLFILFSCLIINSGIMLVSQAALAAPVPVDTSALDRSQRSDTQFGIGYTRSSAERPFVGVNTQTTSLPYFVLNYKDLYVEGLNIGYKLWQKNNMSVDLLATPRYYEAKPSFASGGELDSFDETKPTYLAGLSTQYRSSYATFTLQLLGDVKESDGYEFIASASNAYKFNDSITLAPAIGITYQSASLVDHFYGVQANEVTVNRPEYAGNASSNYYLSVTTLWNARDNIQLLAQVKYEALGSGITDSPVVDKDNIVTAVIGGVFLF